MISPSTDNTKLTRALLRLGAANAALLSLALLSSVTSIEGANPQARPEDGPAAAQHDPSGQTNAFLSVFIDDPSFGKDPFFPNSERRKVVVKTNTVFTAFTQLRSLKLKGVSISKRKRLAIINNRTFEEKEEATVKVDDRRIKVTCLEIRPDSVVVRVNGLTHELFLSTK